MKTILALLLLASTALAQSIPNRQVDIGVLPPVKVTNNDLHIRSVDDRAYRILKEGHLPNMSFASTQTGASRTVRTPGSSGPSTTFTVTPGCVLADGELIIQSDQPLAIAGFIKHGNYSASNTVGGSSIPLNVIAAPGNTYRATLPKYLYEGAQITVFSQYLAPRIVSDSIKAAAVTAMVNGTEFTNHQVWNARKVWLNIGDSMSGANAMGNDAGGKRYMGRWHYSFVGVDSLIAEGKITRLVNRHLDSGTSTDLVEAIRNGTLDDIPFDLLTVFVGFNNAGSSAVTQQFTDELNEIIRWRNRQWNIRLVDDPTVPKPSIILIGMPVTDKTPYVSNVAGYRSAMSALVSTANRVYYYDASTAYSLNATATADVNISSADRTATNRVHPSGIGSTLIGKGLYPIIKTTPFYSSF
ncbi:hypothetical protein G8759_31400 [Spirosoma aureum]|uniref:SGNH/GDSL hydrolase family protein n=1 Tax=Spirosoma aureum TaxID=2692134 RepID=A0A6G9AWG8_9BACT|nr:SGNH/GDSL hydrolase family protein [Spirosoma aureum]QIP16831.1 hypothetical protein G8759_31400 [Spirosoma aureum]